MLIIAALNMNHSHVKVNATDKEVNVDDARDVIRFIVKNADVAEYQIETVLVVDVVNGVPDVVRDYSRNTYALYEFPR